MYGKFFTSTFTGSMFGAGPDVFALWGYVIAHTVEGTVELNPAFVSAVLGTTPERIEAAMAVLLAEDAASRSEAEGGRRLIHEGAFQYRVVNHAFYRALRNEDDRRAYNRDAKRRQRAKTPVKTAVKRKVNDSQRMSTMSAQAEAEAEAETEAYTEAETKKQQQKQKTAAAALIISPAAYARRQAQCAFVGSRLDVPHTLHGELRKALGGADPDAVLKAWYEALNAEIDESGEAITPDVFKWLKARFAGWVTAAARAASEAKQLARLQAIERGEIKR